MTESHIIELIPNQMNPVKIAGLKTIENNWLSTPAVLTCPYDFIPSLNRNCPVAPSNTEIRSSEKLAILFLLSIYKSRL
jgi:hypothetical protein